MMPGPMTKTAKQMGNSMLGAAISNFTPFSAQQLSPGFGFEQLLGGAVKGLGFMGAGIGKMLAGPLAMLGIVGAGLGLMVDALTGDQQGQSGI
ncbi:MAG: hypothetical protein ABH851_00485 [Methanobacteriota archaeon]